MIRLIGKGTIEEDMLQCAQMKLKLEQDINTTGTAVECTKGSLAILPSCLTNWTLAS